MRERKWTMGQLAAHLETQTGMVSKYLFGDVRPKWEWAQKLSDALSIPMSAWAQKPAGDIDVVAEPASAAQLPDSGEAA